MGHYVTGPFFLVTAAIFTVILLQNTRRSLQFRSSSPLLSNSVPPNEPEKGGGMEKKRPIILTACLVMDIVCFLLSFAFLLLLANNVQSIKGVKTGITNGNIGEKGMDDVRIAAYYGIGSSSVCLVTAMLISIYSLVVLFGDKMYLGKEIGHEIQTELLDSSVNDIKCCFCI